MKLYDAMTPNNLRVHIFLAEKGIEVPRQWVDVLKGGTRTPAFLAINSLGELPALELDDGRILTESVAICRYFEALHPAPRLLGEGAYGQARVEMWNRRMELYPFAAIGDVAQHTLGFFADKLEQNPDYAAAQMRRFDKLWAWLDSELSDGRAFVAGESFTIADITGMAVLFVCDIMEKALPSDLVHAKRWEEAMRARPTFVERMRMAA
ncbi:glutathione S-transferase family protein [Algihabitans albus]|uniref:glutathione S-transferase family protein n=1 Tax=Algihabitans albus TaxID=2164067 RepID=UPI000E5D849E|nr:glutathione S-transferase family protein [Algihabitans albus]